NGKTLRRSLSSNAATCNANNESKRKQPNDRNPTVGAHARNIFLRITTRETAVPQELPVAVNVVVPSFIPFLLTPPYTRDITGIVRLHIRMKVSVGEFCGSKYRSKRRSFLSCCKSGRKVCSIPSSAEFVARASFTSPSRTLDTAAVKRSTSPAKSERVT